ncbi:MAG: DUF3794 domain-containing protein [Oscillospiraceae bacterium]|nr:DUF3794 domain-containing protein [Oscillospiraceae bacterium]
MEYKQRRETITVNEVIYDGCQEQPVDLELTLPDYCPDIQKILKCQVEPSILSASLVGDSADINGSMTVRVLYLDADSKKIRCYENTSQFSANLPVKTTTGNGVVLPRTNVEYVNCRATSPRRLDIHGAFSVCACVWEQRDLELLHSVEDDDVEQLQEEVSFSTCEGVAQQMISIEEVLELGAGKPCADRILRTDATVSVEECRVLDSRMLCKGTVLLKVLYLTDLRDALPETMEYGLPFQQMLDCRAADRSQADVSIRLMGANVQIKSDSAGENNLLEAEVKLLATVQSYGDSTVTMVTDAYSRSLEVTLEHQQRTFLQFGGSYTDHCAQKNTFSFPEGGLSKVIDIWNESCVVTAAEEEGTLLYKGKYNLCLLALNNEGTPFYFERTLEMNYGRELNGEGGCQCRTSGSVSNLTYRITGGDSMEIKTEFSLETTVFRERTCRFLTEVIPNPDMEKPKDRSASLVLYYTAGGESLWEIAKQYATSVQAIQSENDLTESVADQPGMLLIPI